MCSVPSESATDASAARSAGPAPEDEDPSVAAPVRVPARDPEADRRLTFASHARATLAAYRALTPHLSPRASLGESAATSASLYLLDEHCPAFDLSELLEGSEAAFHAVFSAFYARDWPALRGMTTPRVAEAMERSVEDFDGSGHAWEVDPSTPSGFELTQPPRVLDLQLHGAAIAHALFCNAEVESACPGFASRERVERGVLARIEFSARETVQLTDGATGEPVPRSARPAEQTVVLQLAGKLRLCGRARGDAPQLGDFEREMLRRAARGNREEGDAAVERVAEESGASASAEAGDARWNLAASFTSFEGDHDAAAEEALPQDFDWVVSSVEY
jgi:hypothetical protein